MADLHRRGDSWRVRWYEPGGARRSRTFPTKVAAERWLTKVAHDKHTGSYVSPDAGRVTFKSYAEEWRGTKAHRETTAEQVESHLRLHVYPQWAHRPIGSITPRDVQALVTGMSLGPAATRVTYSYLSNIFKRAVRDRLIVASPCDDIELPEKPHALIVPLEPGQVLAIRDEIDERHRILVTIGAGAGLRPSEVTGLRHDRVDVADGTITVDAQLRVKSRAELAPLKTRTSYRTVPVPGAVIDAITKHVDRFGLSTLGTIMSTRQGGPVRRGRVWQSWDAAKRAAKAPEWATPHDLRHFYVSSLIAHGLDVKTIQTLLGHKSAITTLDTYGHWFRSSEDKARAAIEATFSL